MQRKLLAPFGVVLRVEVLASLATHKIRTLVHNHGLVLIRGLGHLSSSDLLEIAQGVYGMGTKTPEESLVHWSFGPIMDMKVNEESPNYLFSREPVPLHWDGAFHQEPEILMFHCIDAPREEAGGETLFVHTGKALEIMPETLIQAFEGTELTYRTEKLAHYGGTVTRPVLQKHPSTGAAIIQYAEPVLTEKNPVHIDVTKGELSIDSVHTLLQPWLRHPTVLYTHTWQNGDLLFADNFQLLHGRRSFTEASPRHLKRLQIKNPSRGEDHVITH